jgi:hypothetical protein
MMKAAQRHRELVTHLKTECAWFGKAQVMGVGRAASAHEA